MDGDLTASKISLLLSVRVVPLPVELDTGADCSTVTAAPEPFPWMSLELVASELWLLVDFLSVRDRLILDGSSVLLSFLFCPL